MRTGGMVFLNWIDCFTALPFLSPAELLLCDRGSGRGEEPAGKKVLRLIQIRLNV
jgi:hypothetical protein